MRRLYDDGGPGYATGVDLLEAALRMDDNAHAASAIAQHLGVPLDVVRGWLRDDR